LPLGELIRHHAMQDVGAGLEREHFVRQLDRAGTLGRKSFNVGLHHAPSFSAPASATSAAAGASSTAGASSAAGAAATSPLRRNAPGIGTLSGNLLFTASRNSTQPPFEPGTAPFTMIRPFSASVRTTSRFCVVTRVAPMWPA